MTEYPVIIIGGGIGGLTTAAYLAKHHISSLLIERNSVVGGRCSTRTILGKSYEIGALYVGGSVFHHLRHTFGATCHSLPVRGAVRIGNRFVSFPIDLRHLKELWACGTPCHAIWKYLNGVRTVQQQDVLSNFKSAGEALEFISSDRRIRQFLFTLFSVSGLSPYKMPPSLLSARSQIATYRSLNPEMFISGNSEIANHLLRLINARCHIIRGQEVKKIIVEQGKAVGVRTENGTYRSHVVVSNAGIRQTVLHLTDPSDWSQRFLTRVRLAGESLMVVNVFLIFRPAAGIFPPDVATFFVPYDTVHEFEVLENGRFPERSMFILHVPSNIENPSSLEQHATLQFYYPRGGVDPDVLQRQVDRLMHEGLSDLTPGLQARVAEYVVYDPTAYRQAFGFAPRVFGVAPDLETNRFGIQTPIRGLYCVGDSVEPEGPCVAQAMASGIECAKVVQAILSAQPQMANLPGMGIARKI